MVSSQNEPPDVGKGQVRSEPKGRQAEVSLIETLSSLFNPLAPLDSSLMLQIINVNSRSTMEQMESLKSGRAGCAAVWCSELSAGGAEQQGLFS